MSLSLFLLTRTCGRVITQVFIGCDKIRRTKIRICEPQPVMSCARVSCPSVQVAPLSEPVGGSVPKFPSPDKTTGFSTEFGNSFSLLCPAQGSPIPGYRCHFSLFNSLTMKQRKRRTKRVLINSPNISLNIIVLTVYASYRPIICIFF